MTYVDPDLLAAIAARLDLREPNREAIATLAAEMGQWFDTDAQPPPFEGVIDAATGVGKTYVIAGAIEYFAALGTRNFAVITPGRTILDKTVANFTRGHPKSLTNGMEVEPVVVTSETFNTPTMRRAMEDDTRVKLFIFTVQALTKPTTDAGRRTHKFQEGLGKAFYEHLDAQDDLIVFADEHHCYYGPSFSNAVRGLTPHAIVGLTATPHKKTPTEQIIFQYPLAAAIADGLVKTPVLVGRKDDRTDVETKLLDGIRLLEAKEATIARYCKESGDKPVHPVMLVVAPNIEAADDVEALLRTPALAGGRYGDKVLVVHSKKPDEDLAKLESVEDDDSPVRIIVSVGMLKEGWDVKNVYVILSLRSSISDILTEQTLGRGLRLPWGHLTDWELLDTLEVIAHERYESLLKKAKVINQSFIDFRTRSVIRRNAAGEQVVTTEREPVSVTVIAEGGGATIGTPVIESIETRQAEADIEATVVELHPRKEVQLAIPELRLSPIESAFSLARITDLDPFRKLGQRLATDPVGELRRIRLAAHVVQTLDGFRHTELEPVRTVDRLESPANPIPFDEARQRLEDAVLSAPVVPARKGQRKQLQPILDAFVQGLGDSAEAVLSGYLDRAAGGLIQLITDEHRKFLSAPGYDEVVGWRNFEPVRFSRPSVTKDRYGTFQRGVGYVGWQRSLFDQVWFDSSTERDLANVIDEADSMDVWTRLERRDLEIKYKGGTYNPDFLAIENSNRWIIETKADRDLATENVKAKRKAAQEWANVVNADDDASGTWGYLLVSESDLRQAKEDWPTLVRAAAA